jgi:hypothetical protein
MRKQAIIFCILVGTVACLVIAQPNATQTRATSNAKAENGRWQIVNGTPELARNIMLLDTQTGDSWINCADSKGAVNWCSMARTFEQVGRVQPNGSSLPSPLSGPPPNCLRWEGGVCAEVEPPTKP